MKKYERSQKRQKERIRAVINKQVTVEKGGRATRIKKSEYHHIRNIYGTRSTRRCIKSGPSMMPRRRLYVTRS